MIKKSTHSNCQPAAVLKRLKAVEKLFSKLQQDKTLPTFTEHIALCILLGTSESVNLKNMYPKTHSSISKLLQSNNAIVTGLRE